MIEDSERFSDDPSCAVSCNRITYLFARNYAATISAALIFPEIADKSVIYAGFALSEQESELTVVLDTEEFSGIFSHFILVC